MQINAATGTSDVLNAASIALNGTLNLDVTGSLTNGQTIKLFNATSISGSANAIVPSTPGPGQVWDATKLLVDGTLKAVGNLLQPTFSLGGSAVVNGAFNITGNGGAPSASYQILGNGDLNASLNNWSVVASGSFDANGNFSANVPVSASGSQFLVLKVGSN
jgi:hypothetical protein